MLSYIDIQFKRSKTVLHFNSFSLSTVIEETCKLPSFSFIKSKTEDSLPLHQLMFSLESNASQWLDLQARKMRSIFKDAMPSRKVLSKMKQTP